MRKKTNPRLPPMNSPFRIPFFFASFKFTLYLCVHTIGYFNGLNLPSHKREFLCSLAFTDYIEQLKARNVVCNHQHNNSHVNCVNSSSDTIAIWSFTTTNETCSWAMTVRIKWTGKLLLWICFDNIFYQIEYITSFCGYMLLYH